MNAPAIVYLSRQGALHFDPESVGNKEHVVLNNPDGASVTVRSIGPLVYVVRFGDERKVTLVVFRLNPCYKARAVVIHDVKDAQSNQDLAVNIFSRMLSFDNNRMGNRDRNTLLPIVRQSCPINFSGKFCSPTKTLRYRLRNELLTITDPTDHETVLLRTGYVKMSRSIKDKL
ncbi:hypothetical protein pETSU_175 [Edwardsiella phage pEt-SU]|uniref:Uncharacterized protein n=1 Tax=Edwardsiella phage pEt-SU TaxID=2562142 RepID=A0A4D6DY77_9CAUD|nr:hypothetical protein HOV39_gp175 [Edwardsiella phage pEt-SU]QBZ70756.1 hypothetical protein pETSU_175 [Edwardsiella phage pEt-SU]